VMAGAIIAVLAGLILGLVIDYVGQRWAES
jgi:hypothetical protein